jgi:hypothetical protein
MLPESYMIFIDILHCSVYGCSTLHQLFYVNDVNTLSSNQTLKKKWFKKKRQIKAARFAIFMVSADFEHNNHVID